MSDSGMLQAALRYARRGWPVFPCAPGQKRPAVPHGLLEATTDEGQIREWWGRWPNANVAIATGAPGPDVVDIDVKKGAPGAATRARLAREGLLRGAFAEIITASGGQHLYYLGTNQRNGSLKRHGIDFRAKGGYVLAPPSVVEGEDGGVYRVEDVRPLAEAGTVSWEAIQRFLDPPRSLRAAVQRRRPVSHLHEGKTVADLIDIPVEVGERSEMFFRLVAAAKGEGLPFDDVVALLEPWCEANSKYVGRVEREVERVWRRLDLEDA